MSTPGPVRILQVTDPHLFADAAGKLRGTVTYDSLRSVLADVERRAWPADLIALTGDLIQDDSREAYGHIRELFSPLGLPVHCVPGNHDVRPLMREALAGEPFRYCETHRQDDWLIIGIDSCVDGDAGGVIADEELERLAETIDASDARHIAVCLHHPPRPMQSRWLDGVGLKNADAFLETVAASGRVRTIVFGHVHQVFDETFRGMRILGTPSTCAQFKPRVDDFETDDNPPAYRRILLNPDGTTDTELIWLGEDQAP